MGREALLRRADRREGRRGGGGERRLTRGLRHTGRHVPAGGAESLQSVASVGAITLIWEPNAERDLAGYIVLRGGSERDLQPITTSPITATQFKDDLAPGTRHVYAVRAVDKAGNASAISNLVEDTAR